MIKLIASDIDGTLLPKGQKTIDEDTLRVVSEILDNGIEDEPGTFYRDAE